MSASKLLVSFNAARGPCTVCGLEGLPCARCRVDYYCGKQHQKQDWPRHKAGCGVLELRSDPRLGRHLVAAKDVPAGTILMRELPLVAFPKPVVEPGEMFCVGCFLLLKPGRQRRQCAGCGWPVCSQDCGRLSEAHRPECSAFQRAGFKLKKGDVKLVDGHWLSALAALRTCLTASERPQLKDLQADVKYEDGPQLEGEEEHERMQLMINAMMSRRAFEQSACWVRRGCRITWLSEEELYRAAAVNQVNCFADIFPGGQNGERARAAVYAGLSLMEHNCTPNTTTRSDDVQTGQRLLLAATDVKKGDHLSIDYQDDPMRGTAERRGSNYRRAFVCHCELCDDPTERGLYLGSWCCTSCTKQDKQSYVVKGVCGGCGQKESSSVLNDAMSDYACLQENPPKELSGFLAKHQWPRGPLHPTHSRILCAKMETVYALEGYAVSMEGGVQVRGSKEDAACWISACKDILRVLLVLRPGPFHSQRVTTLLVLHYVLWMHASIEMTAGRPKSQMQDQFDEIRSVLMEMERALVTSSERKLFSKLALISDLMN